MNSLNKKRIIFFILSFLYITSLEVQSQINVYFGYGLEEKSYVQKIKELTNDTNNIVVLPRFNYFYINNLFSAKQVFWIGEEPLCEKNIEELLYRSNIIGFKPIKLYGLFKSLWIRDSMQLINSFKDIGIELFSERELLNVMNNIDNQKEINNLKSKLINRFNLNSLEISYLNLVFDDKIRNYYNVEKMLDYLPRNKTYYFFYDVWDLKGGIKSFFENFSDKEGYNVSIFIGKKGSENLKRGLLQFNNRRISLKKSRFPKYIYLTSDDKVLYSLIKNYNLIIVNELKHCVW